jgi:hypothetical protein
MKNLTPKAMRCGPFNCPSVHQLEDGTIAIIGRKGPRDPMSETSYFGHPIAADEELIIIDHALLDDVPGRWRPIDSAPKDGTVVLAYLAPIYGERPSGIDLMMPLSWRDGYWWDDIDRGFSDAVTHWMPLPLPPIEREGTNPKG